MSLGPGTRLGPYEIVSAMGAGGMGEVYRVRNTKLCRDVAIKVLPTSLTSNKSWLLFETKPEHSALYFRQSHRATAVFTVSQSSSLDGAQLNTDN